MIARDPRPAEEDAVLDRARVTPAAAQRLAHREGHQDDPRQPAPEEHRPEDLERVTDRVARQLLVEEEEQVLVDDVVPREARVSHGDGDVPGRGHEQEHRAAGERLEPPDATPAVIADGAHHHRDRDDGDRNGALRHEPDRQRCPSERQPGRAASIRRALCEPPAVESRHHGCHQHAIGAQRAGFEHEAEHRREEGARDQPGDVVEESGTQAAGEEHRHHRREHARDSRPLVASTERERACREPVHQRRLVQEQRLIHLGRHEVVAHEHLARHLGVASFVVEEPGTIEVDRRQRSEREREQESGPPMRPTLPANPHIRVLCHGLAKVNARPCVSRQCPLMSRESSQTPCNEWWGWQGGPQRGHALGRGCA